jgi:hypothetical protein
MFEAPLPSQVVFLGSIDTYLKGTVPRDVSTFFMNQFPRAPENSHRAVSIFFEKLRRYSQPKVHHRCCGLIQTDSLRADLHPLPLSATYYISVFYKMPLNTFAGHFSDTVDSDCLLCNNVLW